MSSGAWPWAPAVAAAATYRTSYVPKTPGETKLNHNEAPEDLDGDLKAEILSRLVQLPWHRYADPDGAGVRQALAAVTGHPVAGVAVGHGANDLIARLMFALSPGTAVVLVEPDYYVHGRSAQLAGHRPLRVALRREGAAYALDVEGILAAAGRGPALLVLSNPNNPTGSLFDDAAIDRLLAEFPGAIVLDEAYAEFAGHTRQADLAAHSNLAILRTLSKAYALAGVRLGYLLGSAEVVAQLDKLQPPYPISVLQTVAAEVALSHGVRARQRVAAVVAERQLVLAGLRALGVDVLDSHGNFLLAAFGERRPAVLAALARAELAVRDMGDLPDAAGCLRLSIGAPLANARLLAAVKQALDG